MTYTRYIFPILSLMISFSGFAQNPKKRLKTQFTSEHIVLDGNFDEQAWKNAEVATDFVMIAPDNGKPIPNEKRTEVRIVYSNEAIYVAAKMYDPEPNKIPKELTTRDDFATADTFAVFLNGFNDGQQDFRFFTSAAGVQADCVYTETNGEDYTWNAIWASHAKITDYGWAVEMKIPYAALRFSPEKIQTWGLNFYRDIRSQRRQYTWNLITNKISSEANQAGILEGIENINPPTRLFLIPYSSYYLTNNKEQTNGELKGGMDIKYGISDAFTLDAILVPDFGQTKYDKKVLNLGPFEQQFQENRPFFTEGTELFSKGDLFYSRRIGGSPSLYPDTNTNEVVENYPTNVKLLNATKISGRTKNGVGIGFLNAVTANAYANITDTITGASRRVLVEPIANYNITVFDKRFRKNSSVSFVNTNVTRSGEFRDANVSAIVFDLNTKKNTYNLNGNFKSSHVNEYQNLDIKKGYNTSLYFAETSGKYRFGGGATYISKNFDCNDMGIIFQTHYHAYYANASYRILNPTKKFNTFSIYYNWYSEFDNNTDRIQTAQSNISINSTTKKNDYIGFGINSRPVNISDFYDPRSADQVRYVVQPKSIGSYFYISTNYNRKFAVDFNPSYTITSQHKRENFGVMINPRYRFSNRLSMNYSFSFSKNNNNIGWIDTDSNTNDIIYAKRNIITYTNTLEGKYSINHLMNINLSVRHYWSYTINNNLYTLQPDGSLIDNTTFTTNMNKNYSTWNMDLTYSWWFAPGSQMTILYRNNAFNSTVGEEFSRDYNSSVKNLINQQHLTHILSISIRYFIDYNQAKRWL